MCAEKSSANVNPPVLGVLDSGVGGLTVVSQIAKLMPGSKILYFGDNANVPYGNRNEGEIFRLASRMFDFLQDRGVDLVAIACNTISTLTERFQAAYDYPIFSIIDPAAEYTAEHCKAGVGLIATEFTVKSGIHERKIHSLNGNIAVHGEGSARLASLIDSGEFDMGAIEKDISEHLGRLLSRHQVKDIILGCTHYPLVLGVFKKLAPGVTFIDPAILQAQKICEYLGDRIDANSKRPINLHIYTTGNTKTYEIFLKKLKLESNAKVEKVVF
jgi:glutamate racemase